MNKINTEVTLRLETSGALKVGFTQFAPFTAQSINHKLELNPSEESIAVAMSKLLSNVMVVSPDQELQDKFGTWLKEFTTEAITAGLSHTTRTSFSDEKASLHVVLEVESNCDISGSSMLYGRQLRPRLMAMPGGMGKFRQGLDVSAFVRDPNAPIVGVVTDIDPFSNLERGSLSQIHLTAGGLAKLVEDFKTFMELEPQICKDIMKYWVSKQQLPVSPYVLEALADVPELTIDELVLKYSKRGIADVVTELFRLSIHNGFATLARSPAEILEKGDLEEEAELAVFNWATTVTIRALPMVDYDPRDNWERALAAHPEATAYGRRIHGVKEEDAHDYGDEEILRQVLERPHSTPAAVGAALYILDEVGPGLPTPALLELLPQTFVLDFSDYCKALGGEGPFGLKQLNEVKDALAKRWLISQDSALAVLRAQLNSEGFHEIIDNPADVQKLEAAVYVLLKQRTLLHVNYPE